MMDVNNSRMDLSSITYNRGGSNRCELFFHLRTDSNDSTVVHVWIENQIFVFVKRLKIRLLAPKERGVTS